jgi:hypothetical protein
MSSQLQAGTTRLVCSRGAAIAFALLIGAPSEAAAQSRVSETAARQIYQLYFEKALRTPAERKVSSNLIYSLKRARRDPLLDGVPQLRATVRRDSRGDVLVDIKAIVTPGLLAHIESLGGRIVNSHPRFGAIRATLPLEQLVPLAERADVSSVRDADRAMISKDDTSEGDTAHAAASARTAYGVDGTGVSVGVISDSVDALTTLQASGDLPGTVTVLAGQSGNPGSSEGTAMLEIVFDLAPGAGLFFATAIGGQAQFAQNILDLLTAGCDVIVDDVLYLFEPAFQDGVIAQAVETATASGALYFSSAGNSGNLNDGTSGVWEGDYSATTLPTPLAMAGMDAHNFGSGALNQITVDPPSLIVMQWSDALGASGNDYDLYLLNAAGTGVFDASTNVQDGNDDPLEFIDSSTFNDVGNTLVIVRVGGGARFMRLATNRGQLAMATDGETSGHAAAANAFGVAAVFGGAGTPFDGSESVETFSSNGPRQVFFNGDGSAITPGNFLEGGGTVRQKPDITAADGVSTATPGFNPFFGTSAAAPHAAALAALKREQAPGWDTAQARGVFRATALDIEAAGFDRDSGAGIIMANDMLGAIFADGFESGDTSVWSAVAP